MSDQREDVDFADIMREAEELFPQQQQLPTTFEGWCERYIRSSTEIISKGFTAAEWAAELSHTLSALEAHPEWASFANPGQIEAIRGEIKRLIAAPS